MEKEESEREKWEIIKRARESAERAVVLRTQLDAREQTIRELQDEIAKVSHVVTILGGGGVYGGIGQWRLGFKRGVGLEEGE